MNAESTTGARPWGPRRAAPPTAFHVQRQGVATSVTERVLLASAVVLLPLQDAFGKIAGVSPMFAVFAIMGLYVALFRSNRLIPVLTHRVTVSSLVLLFTLVLVEAMQPNRSFSEPIRIAFMFLGALVIATMCRDAAGLRAALWGVLIGGAWLAAYTVYVSYADLSSASAQSFYEASQVREDVFDQLELKTNLNKMSFMAGQAAVVASAWALMTDRWARRVVLLMAALFCLVAAFLPLSRSGVVIALVACGMMFLRTGQAGRSKALVFVVAGIAALWMWVPSVVFARLTFGEATAGEDARARIYGAAINTADQYLPLGIGFGNYWSAWAERHGFAAFIDGQMTALGTHNMALQLLVCSGIPAFLLFGLLLWLAWKSLPRGPLSADQLALYGLTIAALLLTMISHQLYDKSMSQLLGLVVGGSLWIWPPRKRAEQPDAQ